MFSVSRLKAFEKLSDGFKLSENQLEARSDAVELVCDDPGLSRPEHAKLRKQMLSRYGAVLNLGDVG